MHSTEGIVLKKSDAGESDGVFVLYTKDYGKVKAYAQGIKKESAKLKGHLEPLSLCTVHFVSAKNGERLTHASLLHYWPMLRQSPEKLLAAWHIKEHVDQECLRGEKDEPLWNLLVSSFQFLEEGSLASGELDLFIRGFDTQFQEYAGYGQGKL